ncbi:hypothetical protein OSB04_023419 [Centaurea solstitialis]|uniref:Uncharacterized protein n=1 Tax=Centaurea solstitialis TaxID=347529 RepID=A0AA38VZL9_9ASTR|nr:hypothetical protein OSB04_023419 [Centaurea solstitialis]
MVVTASTASLPPFPTLQSFKYHAIKSPNLSIPSPPTTNFIRRPLITTVNRPISATAPNGAFLLSEATPPPESSDQMLTGVIAADNGDGVSVVISALLSIAFVGLSVLTIGVRYYCKTLVELNRIQLQFVKLFILVIYIAVTDYLQKKEEEKFEKEEAEKAKRGGKKKRVRSRAGPKGFGQKINYDDYDDL